MKKKLTFIFLAVFQLSMAQTATSITNGLWNNPLSWDCTCVPMPGYTVTINHQITMSNSYGYSNGGITINEGGKLMQTSNNDLWVNGGTLENHGEIDVRYLWTQAGTFVNDGLINLQSFLNNLNFTNAGTFNQIDSVYTTGNITNNGSFIEIDSMTNDGIFINNGHLSGNLFTNNNKMTNNNTISLNELTNFSEFHNFDSIIFSGSMWNIGKWTNHPNSVLQVGKSLLNDNLSNSDAHFKNNGIVDILDSFYNMDSISGSSTGWFSVQDSSYHSGIMIGEFDFCDYTSPANFSQIVDYNQGGFISSNITFCIHTNTNELELSSFIEVYPNPFSDIIKFQSNEEFELELIDCFGKLVWNGKAINQANFSEIKDGSYYIKIKNKSKTQVVFISKISENGKY